MGERGADPRGLSERKCSQGDATGFEKHDVLCGIDDEIEGFGFCQLQLLIDGLRRGLRLSPALGKTGFSQDQRDEEHPQHAGDGRMERHVGKEIIEAFQKMMRVVPSGTL